MRLLLAALRKSAIDAAAGIHGGVFIDLVLAGSTRYQRYKSDIANTSLCEPPAQIARQTVRHRTPETFED